METKKIAAPQNGNGQDISCIKDSKTSENVNGSNGVSLPQPTMPTIGMDTIKGEAKQLLQKADEAKAARDSRFPIHVFPPVIQEVISSTNSTLKFPVDFIAASLLYAASVAIGITHCVQVMKGWIESAVLYVVLVGHSGANKSHPLSFALKPIHDKDAENFSLYERQRQEYEVVSELSVKERREEGLDEVDKPVCKRNLVSDFTPEALAQLLELNKRGLGVYVDEIAGWIKNFNRYNSGGVEEFWLSSWSGKPVNIDRKSGEPVFIKRPFVSVAGTIQNGLLNELAKDNRMENGFFSRVLFVMPDNLVKENWNTDEIKQGIIDNWHKVITNLMDMPVENDDTGNPRPTILSYTTDAKKALFRWQQENVNTINEEERDEVKGIHSKMEIYISRFALILELLKYACGKSTKLMVDSDSVEGAIALVQYFKQSALQVLAITSNSDPLLKYPENKRKFYKNLPDLFQTFEAVRIGEWFDFKERVVKRFLSDKELFNRVTRGEYEKLF